MEHRNREEAVNTQLALLISKLGVTADAETIQDQRGHLNRMLRFWAQLERATAFSPSLAILDKVRAIR